MSLIINCNSCGATALTENYNLPVKLRCPVCENISIYHNFITCKTALDINKIPRLELIKDIADNVSGGEQNADLNGVLNEISATVSLLVDRFNCAQRLLSLKKSKLLSEFVQKLENFQEFNLAFSKKGFNEFIDNHVLVFSNPLSDEFDNHSIIVAVPKFIKFVYGIKLYDLLGYIVYYVNALTLFTYPLPDSFLKTHGFNANHIDLSLSGNKVIGEDLRLYYNEMNFVANDIDHTESDPSVIVVDREAAFTWMVKKTIMPIKPFRFNFNMSNPPKIEEIAKSVNQIVWLKDFIDNSRIICSGGTLHEFYSLISSIALASNCFALMITENESLPQSNVIARTSGDFGDALQPQDYSKFKIIAIDADSWSIADFEHVSLLQCPIAIYTTNPMFDAMSGNINAPLLYGLCPILSISNYSKSDVQTKTEEANAIIASSVFDVLLRR
jgi:hypothetical protein